MNTLHTPRQLAHTEQPRCAKCRHRHRPDLACWKGAYRDALTAELLGRSAVCWICRGPAATADHIQPRSRGGDDSPANLRPACARCNSARGASDNPFSPEDPTPPAGVPLSPRWQL